MSVPMRSSVSAMIIAGALSGWFGFAVVSPVFFSCFGSGVVCPVMSGFGRFSAVSWLISLFSQ